LLTLLWEGIKYFLSSSSLTIILSLLILAWSLRLTLFMNWDWEKEFKSPMTISFKVISSTYLLDLLAYLSLSTISNWRLSLNLSLFILIMSIWKLVLLFVCVFRFFYVEFDKTKLSLFSESLRTTFFGNQSELEWRLLFACIWMRESFLIELNFYKNREFSLLLTSWFFDWKDEFLFSLKFFFYRRLV